MAKADLKLDPRLVEVNLKLAGFPRFQILAQRFLEALPLIGLAFRRYRAAASSEAAVCYGRVCG